MLDFLLAYPENFEVRTVTSKNSRLIARSSGFLLSEGCLMTSIDSDTPSTKLVLRDIEALFGGEARCIKPKPGEVFVITFPQGITRDHAVRIQDVWRETVGSVPLMIIADGAKLDCIEP
jgi:hypothetical protein